MTAIMLAIIIVLLGGILGSLLDIQRAIKRTETKQ